MKKKIISGVYPTTYFKEISFYPSHLNFFDVYNYCYVIFTCGSASHGRPGFKDFNCYYCYNFYWYCNWVLQPSKMSAINSNEFWISLFSFYSFSFCFKFSYFKNSFPGIHVSLRAFHGDLDKVNYFYFIS